MGETILKSVDNAQVQAVAVSNSTGDRFASQKKKLFERFLEFKQQAPDAPTLTIAGTRTDGSEISSLVLTWSAAGQPSQTAFGQVGAGSSPRLFDLRFDFGPQARQSKIGALPFADGEFDWVLCDTVIEHVGPLERQYLLLKELNRVARRGIFVTTVNRWHPLEFYTGLPLIHWLPDAWWRRMLAWFGKPSFASDSRLNLIGSKELKKLASLLPRSPSFSIGHIRYVGIKASFFLQVRKPPFD
jgi:hypothetical protein